MKKNLQFYGNRSKSPSDIFADCKNTKKKKNLLFKINLAGRKDNGKGTDLGLSLSYHVAKAYEGGLKVVTNEGEGAEFIIQLLLS